MSEFRHGFVHTNGIRMHYVEQGAGPLVVLCHGWPESWYSWRHQIPQIAAAGFRVVAPDQRGYGRTTQPEPIESYNILNLAGDIVGLANALGESTAIIAGHDWGAPVAWHCALLRPDMFRALALLSVPYAPRGKVRPAARLHLAAQERHFYQSYFQEPGIVERELEADVRRAMLGIMYSASGDAAPGTQFAVFDKSVRFIDALTVPDKLPSWVGEPDLQFFVGEFTRSGFRGSVNWYRNFDRNWELTPFLDSAKIMQPTLFFAGERDGVIAMAAENYKQLESNIPNLTGKTLIPGGGHWIQQERPRETTDLLLDFLKKL